MNREALRMATLAVAHEGRFKTETAGLVDVIDSEAFARVALTAAMPFIEAAAQDTARYWKFVAQEVADGAGLDEAVAEADQRFRLAGRAG